MYTSRIRRRVRAAESSLSILDYDSLDIGLHVMDGSRQLGVQNAFAIQSGSSEEVPGVETEAFWTVMDTCEALAARLARVTAPSR